MGEFIRRHAAILALAAYVAAALLSAVSLPMLPLSQDLMAVVFAAETLLLGLGSVCLWRLAHRNVSAMAYRDELTSLANRRAFNQASASFGREERGGTRSLVLFDIDGLKKINEHCGYQAGDELLHVVGQRLAGLPGAVYRIGGDEFAALVDRARGDSAVPVLRRLEPFQAEFAACGHSHTVSVSYGFASAVPGEDFSSLFRRADNRLRQFKRDLYANGTTPERRIEARHSQGQPDGSEPPTPGKKLALDRLRLLG